MPAWITPLLCVLVSMPRARMALDQRTPSARAPSSAAVASPETPAPTTTTSTRSTSALAAGVALPRADDPADEHQARAKGEVDERREGADRRARVFAEGRYALR